MFRVALASLTLLVAGATADTPDGVTSRLMIHIPHSMFREEGYDHREALFGMPPYGGSIAQNVYYADSDLCDDAVDTTKGYPRREMDGNGKMKPWPSPFLLMVDRGNCTFVRKVRNAQKAGAAGVLIADTTCLCSDVDCVEASPSNTCETSEPIMADDGSGGDISIPSFLMFKRDADAVKLQLMDDHPVQMEMSWSLPSPDDRVEYDLWTVPTDKVSASFLTQFKSIAMALGERAFFTPHMYIYDGLKTHCQGNDGENFCYNLCTNNGRYCATDPDNDLDRGISGQDVVKESLRRLCVWKLYGEDGIGEVWWNYINEFMERCNNPDYFMNEDCVRDCYRLSAVDEEKVNRCMIDSGGLTNDAPNSYLDAEIKSQEARGVVVLPTAFVNTAPIRGQLSSATVFSAVCAGYLEGTKPAICDQCATCSTPVECVKTGVCSGAPVPKGSSGGGVSTHTFALSMFMVTAVFAGLGYWHYKKTKDDMRDQVRGILAEYMPLEDNGEDDGTSPLDFARSGGAQSLIS